MKRKRIKTEGPVFQLDEFVVYAEPQKRRPRKRGGAGGGRKATTYQSKPYKRKKKKNEWSFPMFGRRSVD